MKLSSTVLALTALVSAPNALARPNPWKRDGVVPALSGAEIVMTAGTYPRANLLSDGSLIGSSTTFAGGNNTISLFHSTDGGSSWNPLGSAATRVSATSDLDNGYPLQLPSGRIVIAYRNHDKNAAGDYTFFRITMSESNDNGATWSYLSTPASDPGEPNGDWEPFLRNAADGSLQLYYAREDSASAQDILMRTSTDGGVTWSGASEVISGYASNSRNGMPGVTTVSGTNLVCIFETESGGYFTVNGVSSSDDGATWSAPFRIYTPTGSGNNAGSPQIVTVGSTLVASFMTDEDTSAHDWPNQAAAKIVTSGDGGNTWGNKLTVTPVQSFWPGMVSLNSGTFLGMADNGGSKVQVVNLS